MKNLYRIIPVTFLFTMLICSDQTLTADVVWDESINGDLSDNPSAPTPISFNTGLNTVIGSLSEPDGDLRDYLTFTLGPNQFLTGLFLDVFTPNGVSFHAFNAGNQGFIPGEDPADNFLGLELISQIMVGMDLLPDLAAGNFGSTGFSIPLGPGSYTYLIQELTPDEFRSYQITFVVVPEPSGIAFLGLGSLLVSARRARSSHSRRS